MYPDPHPRIAPQSILQEFGIGPTFRTVLHYHLEVKFLIDLGDPRSQSLDHPALQDPVGFIDPFLAQNHEFLLETRPGNELIFQAPAGAALADLRHNFGRCVRHQHRVTQRDRHIGKFPGLARSGLQGHLWKKRPAARA
jgi:hypothetical protein